jgi:hypothetical protein
MRAGIKRYMAYRRSKKPALVPLDDQGVPLTKTKSRAASIHESLCVTLPGHNGAHT